MSIKLIVDSTAEIPQAAKRDLGIEIVPLTVRFGDEEYRDGVDITMDEFYEKLAKSDKLPTTSQVAVEAFADAFRQALTDPDDQVLCMTISSELSGTYQSAMLARQMLGEDDQERTLVLDSRNGSLALAALVLEAVALREKGESLEAIYRQLADLTGQVQLYAAVDTLYYFWKGGRISAAMAAVGTLLKVKPIIEIRDGKIGVAHKARGITNAFEWLLQQASAMADTSRRVLFGHTHAPEHAQKLKDLFSERIAQPVQSMILEIGATVGTYAGPGGVCLVYFKK